VKQRVLIIVQNLPVPFDRRVWLECQALVSAGYRVAVVCPKGSGDPAYEIVDAVELYKYRPYAPGGSNLSFAAECAYSFLATTWMAPKARRSGRFAVIQACNPAGGRSVRLDNFAKATVWSGRRQHTMRPRGGQDKGQRAELTQFVEAIRTGGPMPIGVESLVATTGATIAVGESLLSGRAERA
jgi:hypothetical protein